MALFCESVTYDVDGAMTISGVFDQITLAPLATLPMELNLKLVVGAVRGDAEIGPVPLCIRWESPNGSRSQEVAIPFLLPESVPYTYVCGIHFTIERLGTHWMELTIRDVLLTRIPLPVVQGEQIVLPPSVVVQ
jgi:hypothetical protein